MQSEARQCFVYCYLAFALGNTEKGNHVATG